MAYNFYSNRISLFKFLSCIQVEFNAFKDMTKAVRESTKQLERFNKLEIMANNIGMANVCYTPLLWIFTRGQGIKLLSLVSKQCREDDYLIPVLYNHGIIQGFEGAIVKDPKSGIYLDNPVSVLDFSSLYPSSMVSENLSHDSIVEDEKWLGIKGG